MTAAVLILLAAIISLVVVLWLGAAGAGPDEFDPLRDDDGTGTAG